MELTVSWDEIVEKLTAMQDLSPAKGKRREAK
jgi:hypothetical protein